MDEKERRCAHAPATAVAPLWRQESSSAPCGAAPSIVLQAETEAIPSPSMRIADRSRGGCDLHPDRAGPQGRGMFLQISINTHSWFFTRLTLRFEAHRRHLQEA